jgi:hypothetical protein
MTARLARAMTGALPCAAAALLIGCSGGTSTALPAPTPTPTSAFAPVDQAARGTTMLALGAIKTIDYYGRFLRPGLFPSFVKPHPVPACSASSATATTVTPDVTGRNYTIVIAFYPAGDTTCSKGVTSAIEMYYPNVAAPSATNPQAGDGYSVRFDAQGHAAEYDAVQLVQYADAPLNVDAQFERYDASSVPQGFVRPKPGVFPQTFPIDFPPPLPPPQPIQPLPFVKDLYASIGSGSGTATIGSASTVSTNPSFLPNPGSGPSQFIGFVDSAAVRVGAPDGSGDVQYSAKHSGAAYAFDATGAVGFSPSFPLGAGNTAWTFAPISSGFTAYNFGTGIGDAATYGPGGNIVRDGQDYVDVVNDVEIQTRFPQAGFKYAVDAIDQLRKAAATDPGPYYLGFLGSSQPYTYVFDTTQGNILDFTVIE